MKLSQILTIILCSVLLISCGAKDEASKSNEAKTKETKVAPPVADPAAPPPNDILQAQMNALNKAKNVEKELMEAKAERDRQDKEAVGM